LVTLDASGSTDPDSDALTYVWTLASGPSVTLAGAATVSPTFTAPPAAVGTQTLQFDLSVTDTFGASSTSTVDVTISPNQVSVADAGPDQTVTGGTSVTLAGSATDADNDPLTYQWTQTSGPSVTLAGDTTLTPTFTAPPPAAALQTLTFSLVANDGVAASAPDTVDVFIPTNNAPVASAGMAQTVSGGASVTLDGSGSSDPDGDALTFAWTQTSGPSVTLTGAATATATFAAPAATPTAQTLEFQLAATDPFGASSTGTVSITVAPNQLPLADAGVDQGPIDAGQTVTLDGTGSSDPDGDPLSYSWVQLSGPTVTLSNATAAQPTFVAPNANTTAAFELTVSDGQASASDSVTIEFRAVGTITIVQQLPGADTQVSFTSNLPALSTSVTTANGVAQISAQSVPIGAYTVTVGDLTASGIALTDISCSDTDSTGDVASRTASIALAAGEDVTCTFSAVNSRAAAQVGIYTFLSGRNALILANQPDLRRRIDRLSDTPSAPSGSVSAYGVSIPGAKSLPFQASVSPGLTAFSTSLAMLNDGEGRRNFDVWAEGLLSRATIGDQDADFGIVYLGADYRLRNNVLVGGLVQFDSFSDRDGLQAGEAEGDGWMAGPYVTARLAPQLYVEVRAAWGRSDNMLSPLPGQRDAFETERSLYAGSIFGDAVLGEGTILRPVLSLRYLSEEQLAYTDSLGITIPSQTVDQGEISFSPRLSHMVELNNGSMLRPFLQLEGIYTFGADPADGLIALVPVDFDGFAGQLRGRVESGFDFHSEGVFRASLSGFYDGIGSDAFTNYGLRLGVSVGY
jgi:outer membrane autotransporter protein